MRRVLAVVLLAGLALFVGAGPAAAHNVLIGSDPLDGANVPTSPSGVSLRFNLPVRAGFNVIVVVGPDGLAYQDGETRVDGSTVSVGLRPLGPAGPYEVRYRVLSDDGHPISAAVGFTLTSAGTGTGVALPADGANVAEAPAGGSGGAPLWPWIVAVVVLVAGGVVVALRLSR